MTLLAPASGSFSAGLQTQKERDLSTPHQKHLG
jgi:hypothetical protein